MQTNRQVKRSQLLVVFVLSLFCAISNASSTTKVALGATYIDPGCSAIDNYDGDISNRVETVNTVNTSSIGQYSVTYTVSDSSGNAAAPVVRTVQVYDSEIPQITMLGDAKMIVSVGSSFKDPGATAWDDYDGDITGNIVTYNGVDTSKPGTYSITYTVSDSSKNKATPAVRTILVAEEVAKPVITLTGSPSLKVRIGSTYTDAGATAFDAKDGEISSKIVTTNPVNTYIPGTYHVTYNVMDSDGYSAVAASRTVRVTFWSKTEEDANSLFIASPLNGSKYYASSAMKSLTIALTAHAPFEAESVRYYLDGVFVGESDTEPYVLLTTITIDDNSWGDHIVTAETTDSTTGETLKDESSFTLTAAPSNSDINGNGLADNPFTTLELDGDVWSETNVITENASKRMTCVARLEGIDEKSDTDVPIVLALSDESGPRLSVTVPRSLIKEGETGILVVQAAEDLETLVGAEESGAFMPEPTDMTLVLGGLYVETSILVSNDGGVSFDEIDESRLTNHAAYVKMFGLAPKIESDVQLLQHPSFIDSDALTGLALLPIEGSWSSQSIRNLDMDKENLEARLMSLSVMAPYEPVEAVKTQDSGCAGFLPGKASPANKCGDILLISVALLALVLKSGKAASTEVRATQRS